MHKCTLYWPRQFITETASGFLIGWNYREFNAVVACVISGVVLEELDRILACVSQDPRYLAVGRATPVDDLVVLGEWIGPAGQLDEDDPVYRSKEAIQDRKNIANIWLRCSTSSAISSPSSPLQPAMSAFSSQESQSLPVLTDVYCCGHRYVTNSTEMVFFDYPHRAHFYSVEPMVLNPSAHVSSSHSWSKKRRSSSVRSRLLGQSGQHPQQQKSRFGFDAIVVSTASSQPAGGGASSPASGGGATTSGAGPNAALLSHAPTHEDELDLILSEVNAARMVEELVLSYAKVVVVGSENCGDSREADGAPGAAAARDGEDKQQLVVSYSTSAAVVRSARRRRQPGSTLSVLFRRISGRSPAILFYCFSYLLWLPAPVLLLVGRLLSIVSHSILNYHLPAWMFGAPHKVKALSCGAMQADFRWMEFSQWPVLWKAMQQEKFVSPRFRARELLFYDSMLCALVDSLLGVVGCVMLLSNSETVLGFLHSMTDFISENVVRSYILWFMGEPSGFKLNAELTIWLGNMCIYGLDTWQTAILWLRPLELYFLQFVALSGIAGGLSMIVGFAADVFSVITFYVYALYLIFAFIFRTQRSVLSSLWALFKGKKFNVIRGRIDAHSYDSEQMLLGTLVFCALFFLAPTVAIYYFFFAFTRVVILAMESLFWGTMAVLNYFPIYSLLIHAVDPLQMPAGVYLSVVPGLVCVDGPPLQTASPGATGADSAARGPSSRRISVVEPGGSQAAATESGAPMADGTPALFAGALPLPLQLQSAGPCPDTPPSAPTSTGSGDDKDLMLLQNPSKQPQRVAMITRNNSLPNLSRLGFTGRQRSKMCTSYFGMQNKSLPLGAVFYKYGIILKSLMHHYTVGRVMGLVLRGDIVPPAPSTVVSSLLVLSLDDESHQHQHQHQHQQSVDKDAGSARGEIPALSEFVRFIKGFWQHPLSSVGPYAPPTANAQTVDFLRSTVLTHDKQE